jgi:hypothetical protein
MDHRPCGRLLVGPSPTVGILFVQGEGELMVNIVDNCKYVTYQLQTHYVNSYESDRNRSYSESPVCKQVG